jgi:GT2 family glycosyltransferase
MADRLPSVSVVMPTFNRRRLLPGVVEPLLADDAAAEVIVVVDGCDDGSYEWLVARAGDSPQLRPLWIENRGENGARAAGIRAAQGDVVLLLDDDVRAAPGLARGHAVHHAAVPGLVVVGYMPPELPPERRPGDFTTRLYAREYGRLCRSYEQDADTVLMNLWAGNVSMRREDALRVIVAADPPALAYHADRELGLRCRDAGLRGVFDRSLRAAHLHTRSLDGFARDARAQGAGRIALHRLHRGSLGPHSPEWITHGAPAPARGLLRLCRRPRAGRATAATLRWITAQAGRARAFRLEELSGRLLRRVEQQRGALAAGGRS